MDVEQFNDHRVEHLARQHRTSFVTAPLSCRIDQAELDEVVMYAYGIAASSDEAEEGRSYREVTRHEGHDDCETSRHFWRGVCEGRDAEIGAPFNRAPRKKTRCEGSHYARFKLRGSKFLLNRFSDFFEMYSWYPDVAGDLRDEIRRKEGLVQLNGSQAQKAIYCLYHGANFGRKLEKAEEVMALQPKSGWAPADASLFSNFLPEGDRPRQPDWSNLKPIPPNWLD